MDGARKCDAVTTGQLGAAITALNAAANHHRSSSTVSQQLPSGIGDDFFTCANAERDFFFFFTLRDVCSVRSAPYVFTAPHL